MSTANDWIDIISKLPFDERMRADLGDWADFYDFSLPIYESILEDLYKATYIKFTVKNTISPTRTFIRKLSVQGKLKFKKQIEEVDNIFKEQNCRYMYLPEQHNLRFSLQILSVLKRHKEREKIPIYVYDTVANALLDACPNLFDGVTIEIIPMPYKL